MAAVFFITARPTFAQIVAGDIVFDNNLSNGTIKTGSAIGKNGYRQIFYDTGGTRKFITDEAYPNADPKIEGDYITWMAQIDGFWQILLYHVPTGKKMKLSNSSNNANPKLDGDRVIWESQVNGIWQIYFYDGIEIRQLTTGDMSINPDIEGDFITYSRRDTTGTYRSVIYSIKKDEAKEVTIGESSKKPVLNKGKILLTDGEEFPLTADDIFLLNFNDVPEVQKPVTSDDVLDEIKSLLNPADTIASESAQKTIKQ